MAKRARNALEIVDRLLIAGDKNRRARIDNDVMNCEVAALIFAARRRARLTQQQLADLVGTSQPTIARLEDADYDGHSLTMLPRIATALGQTLELRFVPKKGA
ncbi:MAG: helix-turn-helix transcriptional regulator [Planctomycetota bacterium]|jgi:DNA-binding XRE family transcriptional regulator